MMGVAGILGGALLHNNAPPLDGLVVNILDMPVRHQILLKMKLLLMYL